MKELKVSKGAEDDAHDLRQILHNLRQEDGPTKTEGDQLLDLQFDNPALPEERHRCFLNEEEIWINKRLKITILP